jgi:type VI secretion system secreted protein Hcp
MPTPAYLTIKGSRQGLISAGAMTDASVGNLWQLGHEDQILVQGVEHRFMVPKGGTAGKRMHSPMIITKMIDKSSPLIFNALCTGESLGICRLDYYRTSSHGTQENYYTVELEDALIVGIEEIMPHCQDLSTAHFMPQETVHIAYRRITKRHEVCRTMGADEWQEA